MILVPKPESDFQCDILDYSLSQNTPRFNFLSMETCLILKTFGPSLRCSWPLQNKARLRSGAGRKVPALHTADPSHLFPQALQVFLPNTASKHVQIRLKKILQNNNETFIFY